MGGVVTELYEAYPFNEDLAAFLSASFIALGRLLSKSCWPKSFERVAVTVLIYIRRHLHIPHYIGGS